MPAAPTVIASAIAAISNPPSTASVIAAPGRGAPVRLRWGSANTLMSGNRPWWPSV